MITTEWRVDTHLRSPAVLTKLMAHHDYTVRTLAKRVGCSRATIGHLRSGQRSYCNDKLAKLIARALDTPTDLLFEARPSTVSRERGPSRRAA